jgi:hypothetical protein
MEQEPPAAQTTRDLVAEVAEMVSSPDTHRDVSPDRGTDRSRSPVASPTRSSVTSDDSLVEKSGKKPSRRRQLRRQSASPSPSPVPITTPPQYYVRYLPTQEFLTNRNGNPVKVSPPLEDVLDTPQLEVLAKRCGEKRCGLFEAWHKRQISFRTMNFHYRMEPHGQVFELQLA